MADINHVVLVGRLTRDAELKFTSSGQAVCKFSLAINRRRKVGEQWEDEANYFDVVLWGRQGESLTKYLLKGKAVGVEGQLRQDRWQQDGQNRSRVEIVAENIQLMGGGGQGSSSGQGNQDPGNHGSGTYQGRGGDSGPAQDDGFADDIPF